jgi:general secretion pathway protein A
MSETPVNGQGTSTTYEGHFELREAPFALTANPHYLFESRSLSTTMAAIAEALKRHEAIVIVTGASGTGKTLVCRALASRKDLRTFVALISTPPDSRDDLLRHILDEFGVLSSDNRGAAAAQHFELVRTLRQFLAGLDKVKARALIVVDDAHRWPAEMLDEARWLSNFETDSRKLLQVMLVGEPHLEEMLARPDLEPLRQRATRRQELLALQPEEVGPYIERRLRVARGTDGGPSALFTVDAVDSVAAISRGVPRVVNLLCDRALELAFTRRRAQVDRWEVVEAARALRYEAPSELLLKRRPSIAVATATFAAAALAGFIVWRARPQPPTPSRTEPPTLSRTTPPPEQRPAAPVSGQRAIAPAPAVVPDKPHVPVVTPADAKSPSSGTYNVLASSFRSLSRAEELAKQIAALTLDARVRSTTAGWHQVVVGPYQSREEAMAARERLKAVYVDGAEIVSTSPGLPPVASGKTDQPAGTIKPVPPESRARRELPAPAMVIQRATALSRKPDVRGLVNLRAEVESRPASDPAAQLDRDTMLKEIDTLLEDARRRQLEIDAEAYRRGQSPPPR